jgi:hypothetical protein
MSRSKFVPRTSEGMPRDRFASLRTLGLLTCLLCAVSIALGSAVASAQDRPGGSPAAGEWSAWLQRHLELEYPAGFPEPALSGLLSWAESRQRQLELEYPV